MSQSQDFVVFWQRYPRKVGKLAAEKAYERARKMGVTQEQIITGVSRYIENKPAYADWAHPATWLNQGRWDDEYEPVKDGRHLLYGGSEWWDECKRLHNGQCNGRSGHHVQMQIDAGRRSRAAGAS